LNITEVLTKKDLKNFINVPWTLYKDDPNWVAPLKMAVKELFDPKHPFYKTSSIKSWLLESEGVYIGRISAVYNTAYNEFHNENAGFYGFFECSNNQQAANKLLETAENFLKEKHNIEKIYGPMNPSTNYECGSLVEGFDDPPQLMMTYNQKYHAELMEKSGYTKAKDLLALNINMDFEMPEVFRKVSERAEKRSKVTYRHLNKKDWDNEIEKMIEIYNSAWEKNWGFIPMSREEFYHTAKDLKTVADERLIIFVEVDGDPAGFVVTLPDLNQALKHNPSGNLLPTGIFKVLFHKKYVDRCRVITLGIKAKYRNLGLGPLMYLKSYDVVKQIGYRETEMSWILEDNNDMCKPLFRMGGEVYKKYRIYEKTF